MEKSTGASGSGSMAKYATLLLLDPSGQTYLTPSLKYLGDNYYERVGDCKVTYKVDMLNFTVDITNDCDGTVNTAGLIAVYSEKL